jgi:predicted MFS family arabinose efflux permease
VLGVSASFVSLANAVAPLLGGLIFQSLGASAPFAIGGAVMLGLLLLSITVIKPKLKAEGS